MKKIFAEKNIVVILFIIVLIAFSFAERDSKKLEKLYTGSELVQNSSISYAKIISRIIADAND
ncbi:MAG: hypothetical protein ACM3VS_06990 [Candidatus Dadabacteria bacterium]